MKCKFKLSRAIYHNSKYMAYLVIILIVLRQIMCANVFVAGSTNSAGRCLCLLYFLYCRL
jgi:hypothetical protein